MKYLLAKRNAGPRTGYSLSLWFRICLCLAIIAGPSFAQTVTDSPRKSRPPTNTGHTLAALQTRISNHIAQPRFAAAHWGVKIVSLDSGQTWFDHNAGKYFIPASNTKLFTGAVALDRLGPDFRIRTSLYAARRPNASGTLEGDLIVYGRGDPSFSRRFHKANPLQPLEALADGLAAAGVERITGDLVGDESFLRADALGSGWTWDDLDYYYSAEVSALSVNDNVLDVAVQPATEVGARCEVQISPPTEFAVISNLTVTATNRAKRSIALRRALGENVIFVTGQMALDDPGYSDPITVHKPAGLFLDLLQQALRRRGISIAGTLRTVGWRERETQPLDVSKLAELAFVESPPFSVLLNEMEKPSQNLHAQLFLLQVGTRGQAGSDRVQTAEEAGIAELKSLLNQAGIASGVLFEEGSGLSRRHLVTPSATVALLKHMNTHRWADAFRESLPIAGVDGTLRNRMRETAAAGNVRAKTGTLRYVNALAGYVATAAGERLAFACYLNNYNGSAGRNDLDAIAVMLAEFDGKP
jgi:D-alanyl-D-alanine carboxypeptidase/D-alanyl-D-alanine-endopeptidase (penicillin-binding protein 4)